MFSGLKSSEKPPRHNALPIAALFQGAPDGQCARRNAKLHAAPVSFCARPTATLRIFSAARSMFSGPKTGEKPPCHNALPIAALFQGAPDGQCARRSAKPHGRSDFVLRASHRGTSNIQRRSVDVFRPENRRKTAAARNCMPLRFRFARVPPRRFEYSAPLGRCFPARKPAKNRRVTTRFLSPRSFRARQTANARVAARNHTAAPISFCARPTAALRIFSAARSMFSGLKTGEKPPHRPSAQVTR